MNHLRRINQIKDYIAELNTIQNDKNKKILLSLKSDWRKQIDFLYNEYDKVNK